MIETSQTFYDNSVFKYRSTKAGITIKVMDSSATASVSVSAYKYFHIDEMQSNKGYEKQYATCEPNEFILDGTLEIMPDDTTDEQLGWWTPLQPGYYQAPPTITFELDDEISTAGITCYFDSFSYPEELTCQWYNGTTLLDEKTICPTSGLCVFENAVDDFDKVVIEVTERKAYSYAKMSSIGFGIVKEFSGDEIESASTKEMTSIMSNTLSPNELKFSIFNYDDEYNVFDTTNLFKYFTSGQKCIATASVLNRSINRYEEIPMGTYYLTEATVEDGMLNISACGLLNILNAQTFRSPFYTNATVSTIVGNILSGYEYYIHPNVKDIQLSGYIPVGTKKEALKYVAIASNSVVKEGRDGKIYIYKATEDLSTNQIVSENTVYNSNGLCGLMYSGLTPIAQELTAQPYLFTVGRDTRLSRIDTDMIGVYNRCDVTYKTYTLGSSETLFSGNVTTDEDGYGVIEYGYPVSVTSASAVGDPEFTHYSDCTVFLGAANSEYTVTVTGMKYTVTDNVVSSYTTDTDSVSNNSKLTASLNSCNTLISSVSTAKSCATWYLGQLKKRKDVSFEWWAVATTEAPDYIKVELTDGTLATMQITEIDYNLCTLVAKVKGVM